MADIMFGVFIALFYSDKRVIEATYSPSAFHFFLSHGRVASGTGSL